MNKLRILIIITFAVCVASCKKSVESVEKNFIENAIEQIENNSKYDWIIVLPGLGCHGCIQEGEFFMKENVTNERILFVLTNISSLKILQQKIGIKINEHSNVFVDRSNQFKLTTENAIYPCVIEMKNGKILQYAFQSPQTVAFHNIKKRIN